MTVTQASNGTEGIESATASAAAILSQLNEMVQGQQQQQQNAMNYITTEIPNSNRTQSEKVILLIFLSVNIAVNYCYLGYCRCTFSCSNIKNKFWYKESKYKKISFLFMIE